MKNRINLIACVSKDYCIGLDGQLIWRIPADMEFFKNTTMGGVVVMGRKTFESIGNPLPGRKNVVLSSQPLTTPGVDWCTSKADLDEYLSHQETEIFIIGGASLYQMYLDRAENIYLTEVDGERPADAYFPKFEQSEFDRQVLTQGEADGIKFEIVKYTRKE